MGLTRPQIFGERQRLLDALVRIRHVSDVSLSHDARRAVYAIREIDAERDGYTFSLWLLDVGRGSATRLADGWGPRWSPVDDVVAFLRPTKDAAIELALISLGNGVTTVLGAPLHAATRPSWDPSGRWVTTAAVERRARPRGAPRVIEDPDYRNEGSGFTDDCRSEIFVGDVSTGDLRRLTRGDGTAFTPAWSPDGGRVAFVRRSSGKGRPRCEIRVHDLQSTQERLLTANLPHASGLSWSPGGRWLACFGNEHGPIGEEQRNCLYAIDTVTGDWRVVNEADQSIVLSKNLENGQPPVWEGESRVLARVATRGDIQLVGFQLAGGGGPVVEGPRQVLEMDLRHGCLLFAASEAKDPCVLYLRTAESRERRVMSLNEHLAPVLDGLTIEHRSFPVDERRIDGWVIRRSRAGGLGARLAVSLHGGPHAYSSSTFSEAHFYRYILATAGWTVLLLNHTGSASYGRAFAEAIHGHWGRVDEEEVLRSAKELAEAGLCDGDRWGIVGYSYGGFLAAHAIGHTARFKAAVIGAPIIDFESFAGTSDIGRGYIQCEMALEGEDGYSEIRGSSPLAAAGNVETPTLLLHGESDLRCPVGQSEEFFAALKARSRAPVRFVRYPDATHGFPGSGRPSQRVDYHGRISDWLEEYVMDGRN